MSERELFLAALDIDDIEKRARFLVEQCGPDLERLKRLQNLLLAKSAAGSFLEPAQSPAADPAYAPTAAGALEAESTVDLLGCDEHIGAVMEQRKWADAEPLLHETLEIREKKEHHSWVTFNTHSLLGGAFLGQKKYAEAEPLLLKGYEGLKAREKDIPKGSENSNPEALDRLIELYTATNKPDEAKKWQTERAKYPAVKPPEPKK